MNKLWLVIGLCVGYIVGIAIIISIPDVPANTISLELPPVAKSPNRNWGVRWDQDDLNCLALNIYFEARSEPIEGQYAVGDVVMYRTLHAQYPDDICNVVRNGIYHSWNPNMPVRNMCQFSWWCDGKSDTPVNGKAFETAMIIAKDILTDPTYPGMIDYALFYHAEYVQPKWASEMELVATIGTHHFYRPR